MTIKIERLELHALIPQNVSHPERTLEILREDSTVMIYCEFCQKHRKFQFLITVLSVSLLNPKQRKYVFTSIMVLCETYEMKELARAWQESQMPHA